MLLCSKAACIVLWVSEELQRRALVSAPGLSLQQCPQCRAGSHRDGDTERRQQHCGQAGPAAPCTVCTPSCCTLFKNKKKPLEKSKYWANKATLLVPPGHGWNRVWFLRGSVLCTVWGCPGLHFFKFSVSFNKVTALIQKDFSCQPSIAGLHSLCP